MSWFPVLCSFKSQCRANTQDRDRAGLWHRDGEFLRRKKECGQQEQEQLDTQPCKYTPPSLSWAQQSLLGLLSYKCFVYFVCVQSHPSISEASWTSWRQFHSFLNTHQCETNSALPVHSSTVCSVRYRYVRKMSQSFVLAVLYVFASLEKLKSIKIAEISSSFLVWMVLF